METTHPRIIILTAKFGEGHLQASQALKQSLLEKGITNVTIIDLLQEAHPLVNKISKKIYITSTKTPKYGLDYYGWSYYMTREYNQNSPWRKYVNYLGEKKLREIINDTRPDAIINVFPFGAAPEVAHGSGILTFTVLTDYALHARWVHPETDKYYVATQELKTELEGTGFKPEQIKVSGIPIRTSFYHVSGAENPFRKFVNPNKSTVLITGGAYGVLNEIEAMAKSLITRPDCQLFIVCGRNKKMEGHFKEIFSKHSNVHVFGFVENIQDLMALSSCIITKAGGLTLTEALSLTLPVFIYKPFGGQERENALFFQNKKSAMISDNVHELEEQIVQFLSDESIAKEMKINMQSFRKMNSADFIANDILQTINQQMLIPM